MYQVAFIDQVTGMFHGNTTAKKPELTMADKIIVKLGTGYHLSIRFGFGLSKLGNNVNKGKYLALLREPCYRGIKS